MSYLTKVLAKLWSNGNLINKTSLVLQLVEVVDNCYPNSSFNKETNMHNPILCHIIVFKVYRGSQCFLSLINKNIDLNGLTKKGNQINLVQSGSTPHIIPSTKLLPGTPISRQFYLLLLLVHKSGICCLSTISGFPRSSMYSPLPFKGLQDKEKQKRQKSIRIRYLIEFNHGNLPDTT